MLTGDAAGLVNSINGEGMQYAMQSGRWAAESIITCLGKNDLSAKSLKIFETLSWWIIHKVEFGLSEWMIKVIGSK